MRRLSRRSSYAADQIRNGRIPTLPQSRRKKRRRRDEVSELDENYDLMLRTVGQQFSRIQEDRARILQLLDMYDVDGRIEAEYILPALDFVSETYEVKLLRAVCQVEPERVFSLRSLQKSRGCFIA